MKEECFINIEHEDKRFSINIKEILYIEKQEYESKIYTENGTYDIGENSSSIKRLLKEENFFKCSNSYIVNLDKCEFYLSNNCIFVGNNFIRILGLDRKKKLEKKLEKLYDYKY
ncbi:LytTR family transcriptional regulator DNA-binding domain-containing protein [Clostridioides difficile]|nr:LytTR family transcriptional regulator [Clostridioides difficile]